MGIYGSLKDAALACDYAAGRLFGEFALLNLPAQAIPETVQAQVERVLARKQVGQGR